MALATTVMIHVETAAATVVPAGEEAAMVATARNHAAEDTLAVALALAEGDLDAEDHAADLTHAVPPEGAQDQSAARNPRSAKSHARNHARSHARRSARRAIPLRLSFVTIQDQDLAVLVAAAVTEEEAAVDLAATLAAPAVTMLTMVVTMTVDMDTATSEQTSANFVEV